MCHAIMAGLEVNSVKIIFDNIIKKHSSFLPCGALLSHVFQKFKIDLTSETSVVKLSESFDLVILYYMKLNDFPQLQP